MLRRMLSSRYVCVASFAGISNATAPMLCPRRVNFHGGVAELDSPAVGEHEILRQRDAGSVRSLLQLDQLPVGFRHADARHRRGLLDLARAAEVIVVAVADQDVLDIRRIELELLDAFEHRIGAGGRGGVNQDDPAMS